MNSNKSRWGSEDNSIESRTDGAMRHASNDNNNNNNDKNNNNNNVTVSDQEALQALLSSAQARQAEKTVDAVNRKQRFHSTRSDRDGSKKRKSPFETNNNNNSSSSHDRRDPPQRPRPGQDYYGPARDDDSSQRRRQQQQQRRLVEDDDRPVESERTAKQPPSSSPPPPHIEPTHKPDFGLSGALAKDEVGGNVYKGVVLKFSEPPEARAPNTQWRFYVFKQDDLLETLHIAKQSAYLIGRNPDIADVVVAHGSCSSQHAVLQYRAVPNRETNKLQCRPYLMDLESTNGSFLNGVRIDSARYYELKKGDVLKFGASTRDYVLLTANTTQV